MGRGLLCLVAIMVGCVTPHHGESGHPDCPRPPADTFSKAGVDVELAESTFKDVVTGKFRLEAQPELVSLVSQAAKDAEIYAYIRCLAIKRDGFSHDEVLYLEAMQQFMSTSPSTTEFLEWQAQNRFPGEVDDDETKLSEGLLERARNKRRQGQDSQAAILYEEFLQLEPTHTSAIYELASTYRTLQQSARVIAVLEEGIRRNPRNGELYWNLGIELMKNGDNERAIAVLERGLPVTDGSLRARLFHAQGQAERNLAVKQAHESDQEPDFRRAIEAWKRATLIEDCPWYAYSDLAMVTSVTGHQERAQQLYEGAIARLPDDPLHAIDRVVLREGIRIVFRNYLAVLRLRYEKDAGEHLRALGAAVDAAFHRDPDDAVFHYYKAYFEHAHGRVGDAIATVERAVLLDPKYVDAWLELALYRQEHGLGSRAKEAVQNAFRVDRGRSEQNLASDRYKPLHQLVE